MRTAAAVRQQCAKSRACEARRLQDAERAMIIDQFLKLVETQAAQGLEPHRYLPLDGYGFKKVSV